MQQVLSASRPELIEVFTGLLPRTFRRLVGQIQRRGGRLVADGIKGRQCALLNLILPVRRGVGAGDVVKPL